MALAGKNVLVDGRTCSHPLPSLSDLWSFIYDVCKKNKALNQGARAVKATPLLSHKCRDIIPAVKPFPLSQPQGKPSQVFCCSFSSVYVHTSGGAKKKKREGSFWQSDSVTHKVLLSPAICWGKAALCDCHYGSWTQTLSLLKRWSPEAMEFVRAVKDSSPNVITTAGSKSCHCLHCDFPFCKTSGPRRYFPWINF